MRYAILEGEEIKVVGAVKRPANAACVVPVELYDKAIKLTDEPILIDGVQALDKDGNAMFEKVASLDAAAQAIKEAEELAESAEAMKSEKYSQRYDFARKLKIKIAMINESKSWDVTQTQSYLQDSTIQQINALISDISFASAKTVIDAADLTSYYTIEEVGELSTMIGDYLAAEGA